MLAALLRRLLSPLLGPAPPADIIWITTELAQSGRFASHEAPALASLSIRAVLDLRTEERHRLEPLGKAGLHYMHVAVQDNATPTADQMARAAEWVCHEVDDERKVLVHCHPHTSASATVLAATLLCMGHPLTDALVLIGRRPETFSDAQLAALHRYEEALGR